MNFQKALEYLKGGRCVRRTNWAKTYCIILKDNTIHAYVHIPEQWKEVEKSTTDDRFFTYNDVTANDWEEYKEFYKSNKEVNEKTYGGCMKFKGYLLYKTLIGKKFFYGGLRLPAKVTNYFDAERFICRYLNPVMVKMHLYNPYENWHEQGGKEFSEDVKPIIEKVIKENWLFDMNDLPKYLQDSF